MKVSGGADERGPGQADAVHECGRVTVGADQVHGVEAVDGEVGEAHRLAHPAPLHVHR